MTIAFTRILLHPKYADAVGSTVLKSSTFAVILGSNLGANFTLIGTRRRTLRALYCVPNLHRAIAQLVVHCFNPGAVLPSPCRVYEGGIRCACGRHVGEDLAAERSARKLPPVLEVRRGRHDASRFPVLAHIVRCGIRRGIDLGEHVTVLVLLVTPTSRAGEVTKEVTAACVSAAMQKVVTNLGRA
jgi:hypothetical protein